MVIFQCSKMVPEAKSNLLNPNKPGNRNVPDNLVNFYISRSLGSSGRLKRAIYFKLRNISYTLFCNTLNINGHFVQFIFLSFFFFVKSHRDMTHITIYNEYYWEKSVFFLSNVNKSYPSNLSTIGEKVCSHSVLDLFPQKY